MLRVADRASGGRRHRGLGSTRGIRMRGGRQMARRVATRSDGSSGIRNLIHDRPDPDWILRAEIDAGLGVLGGDGCAPRLRHLGPLRTALTCPGISERHSEAPHRDRPPRQAADRCRRRRRTTAVAGPPRRGSPQSPLVSAKVSGLYRAHGAMYDWTAELLRPFVDDSLEVFGAERLMWGSDWPVSVLAGGYDRVWDGLADLPRRSTAPNAPPCSAGPPPIFTDSIPGCSTGHERKRHEIRPSGTRRGGVPRAAARGRAATTSAHSPPNSTATSWPTMASVARRRHSLTVDSNGSRTSTPCASAPRSRAPARSSASASTTATTRRRPTRRSRGSPWCS